MSLLNWSLITFSVSAMTSIIRNRFHLLVILLSLEALMLTLIIQALLIAYSNSSYFLSAMIILCFSACEASMGLALLVSLIRARGNQSMKVLSLHKL